MIRSSSRYHSAGRFLCTAALAVVVLMMFSSVAQAQEAPAPAEKLSGGELIWFMIKSLGIVFGPILLAISVAMMALVVLLFLDLRMSSAIPPGFVDEFTDIVNKRKFKEAFEMAKEGPVVPRPGADGRHGAAPVRPGGRPRGGPEHPGKSIKVGQGPEEQLQRP